MTKDNNDAVLRMDKPLWKKVQTQARKRDVPGKVMLETVVEEWFEYKKAEAEAEKATKD